MTGTRQEGFTLLETLVALAILAVAMAAVLRTARLATGNVEEMRLRILADWVAQNRMNEHAARNDWLAVGSQTGEETQAGIRLQWREVISDTPNPSMRRIEVIVYLPGNEQYKLRTLSGFMSERPRR